MTEEARASKFDFHDVRLRLKLACKDMLEHENELFFIDVNERSITHRLAVRLETLFDGMDVDCEYNRRGKVPKTLNINAIKQLLKEEIESKEIEPDDTQATTVYPDIIIHKRYTDDNNLLVIEAKKRVPLGETSKSDEEKLIGFTSKGDFHYRYGAFINFQITSQSCSCEIRWYKNGRFCNLVDPIPQGKPR